MGKEAAGGPLPAPPIALLSLELALSGPPPATALPIRPPATAKPPLTQWAPPTGASSPHTPLYAAPYPHLLASPPIRIASPPIRIASPYPHRLTLSAS